MTIRDALFVLWFFLPAGLANMTPIFAARLPALSRWSFPLDGYATFRGKRVFGSHKTIRGVVSGMLIGIVTVYLQVPVYAHVALVRTFVLLDYTAIQPLLVIDPQDGSRWIEVRGKVVEIQRAGAEAHTDTLTQRYTGKQRFYGDIYPVEQKQKETRVIVKIEPVKVSLDAIFK